MCRGKIVKIKSHAKSMLPVGTLRCIAIVIISFTFSFAGSYSGQNPTLAQIDSAWRAFYGSPVHQGIVVYNKMTGGTTRDSTKDTICLMRLVSGAGVATIKPLVRFVQYGGVSGWGVSSCYRISPDGAKIAAQNNSGVMVCDTNGANMKWPWLGSMTTDQVNLSWDDSAGIRRIVYSTGLFSNTTWHGVIARTVVNADNTAGRTDTLWNHAWGRDPAAGNTALGYTSVNKVGHYICFDMPIGLNLPVIVNLTTRTAINPTATSPTVGTDGCQARLCQDTFGTISYHQDTHLRSTTLWRWTTNGIIGYVPCPNTQTSGCSDCGNNGYYWCDSDTNYMVQTGDNQASISPGCYTKAFIRKGKTAPSTKVMYLGDYIAWPALWIDPNPFVPTATIDKRVDQVPSSRISIRISGKELAIASAEGRTLDNVRLINVRGMVVARGERTAPDRQRFTVASLPMGIYLLTWQEANIARAKYITITR
jgi:hypothetical protein